jgi:glyoxylase-like metal-dependent hydrolase (beta-lactamase superfamily II)
MQGDLVQDWFEVVEMEPGIVRILEPLHEELVSSYLVIGTELAVLIDTGMGVGDLAAVVADLTPLPVQVINSHAHWDHIGANWRFERIAIHRAEAADLIAGMPNRELRSWFIEDKLRGPLPEGTTAESVAIPGSAATQLLDGGEVFDLGGRSLEIVHAPGHSPGGIVLLDRTNGVLFSTDVAYPGPLHCQSDDADLDTYAETMRGLKALSPSLRVVYPSHERNLLAPGTLASMSEALDAIQAGRSADSVDGEVARHRFHGFSILVPA